MSSGICVKFTRARAELVTAAAAGIRQARLRITEVECSVFDTALKSTFPKKCDPTFSRLQESLNQIYS